MDKIVLIKFRTTSGYQKIKPTFPAKCVYCGKPVHAKLSKDISHKHVLRTTTKTGMEKITEYMMLSFSLEIPYCREHYAIAAKFNQKMNLALTFAILISLIPSLGCMALLPQIAGLFQGAAPQPWFYWALGVGFLILFFLSMRLIRKPIAKLFFKGINPDDIRFKRHLSGLFNTLGFYLTVFKPNKIGCIFANAEIAQAFKRWNP